MRGGRESSSLSLHFLTESLPSLHLSADYALVQVPIGLQHDHDLSIDKCAGPPVSIRSKMQEYLDSPNMKLRCRGIWQMLERKLPDIHEWYPMTTKNKAQILRWVRNQRKVTPIYPPPFIDFYSYHHVALVAGTCTVQQLKAL